MRYLRICLAAMILIMPATTLYAATATLAANRAKTATMSQDFAGIISFIDDRRVVINGAEFPLVPPSAPAFKGFAPGDHVLVRIDTINNMDMVVAMSHLSPPNGDGSRRSVSPGSPQATRPGAAPALKGQATVPASQGTVKSVKPGNSAPVKQQNGVWTN